MYVLLPSFPSLQYTRQRGGTRPQPSILVKQMNDDSVQQECVVSHTILLNTPRPWILPSVHIVCAHLTAFHAQCVGTQKGKIVKAG